MEKEKTIYIAGHRNPDADSIISAYSYAYLKHALGQKNCVAVRAGNANSQTEYIFKRFKAKLPPLLPDLIPKVKYYASRQPLTVAKDSSLWDALQLMAEKDLDVLPIVDEKGGYHSLLYYEGFAHYIIGKVNPDKRTVTKASIELISQTLKAQEIVVFENKNELVSLSIMVTAAETKTVEELIAGEDTQTLAVLTGDRADLQRYAIERHARLLIITNGYLLAPDLIELAKKNGVTVLASPYDTATTGMMMVYCAAAAEAGDKKAPTVKADDPIKAVRGKVEASAARALPVTDSKNRVTGLLTESDLIKTPNVEVILVDHNELGQAIEGVENYKIIEVLDHHRLGGSLHTTEPIMFLNKVVGSTSSIVASLFREYKVPIPKEIAGLLLGGLISDTMALRSATTTETDRLLADYLTTVAQVDFDDLAAGVAAAANQTGDKTPKEIISLDQKEYTENDNLFFISQIETNDVSVFISHKEDYLSELASQCKGRGAFLCALLVTDVTQLSSYLFIEGAQEFLDKISYPKTAEHVYFLKGVLSRKKQLIPLFTEIINALK